MFKYYTNVKLVLCVVHLLFLSACYKQKINLGVILRAVHIIKIKIEFFHHSVFLYVFLTVAIIEFDTKWCHMSKII